MECGCRWSFRPSVLFSVKITGIIAVNFWPTKNTLLADYIQPEAQLQPLICGQWRFFGQKSAHSVPLAEYNPPKLCLWLNIIGEKRMLSWPKIHQGNMCITLQKTFWGTAGAPGATHSEHKITGVHFLPTKHALLADYIWSEAQLGHLIFRQWLK